MRDGHIIRTSYVRMWGLNNRQDEWGLCPQTPGVYRFCFPAGVADWLVQKKE